MRGAQEDQVLRVAVLGDQPVSRTGMEKLVNDEPGLVVAASVDTVEELPATPGGYHVVVLDLPARLAGTTVDTVRKAASLGRLLVCATWDRPPTLLAAIRAGARGCVTRHTEADAVREALHVVAGDGFYLCPRLVPRFQAELSAPANEDHAGLAPREVETLRWIAQGFTHAQIATRMGLTLATVNTYAKRIRAKLSVNNKAELTRLAIELGYLPQRRTPHRAA